MERILVEMITGQDLTKIDVYKRQVLGPAPIGLIGMLPMLAAAVWLTLRRP